MASPKQKKKLATLARVRDNQRRCRARKREYVVELEKKIRDLQDSEVQTSIENYQITVQRLEAENGILRTLLSQAGFSQSEVEAQLQDGRYAGSLEDGSKNTEIQGSSYAGGDNVNEFLEPSHNEVSADFLPDTYGTEDLDELLNVSLEFPEVPQGEFNFDLSSSTLGAFAVGTPLVPQILDGTGVFPYSPLLFGDWTACPPSASPFITARPGHLNDQKSDGDTTLCSVAYDLVRQHNKKGVDMMEICIRLWNGLQKGNEGEGCKVENKLLFSVLEYIRG